VPQTKPSVPPNHHNITLPLITPRTQILALTTLICKSARHKTKNVWSPGSNLRQQTLANRQRMDCSMMAMHCNTVPRSRRESQILPDLEHSPTLTQSTTKEQGPMFIPQTIPWMHMPTLKSDICTTTARQLRITYPHFPSSIVGRQSNIDSESSGQTPSACIKAPIRRAHLRRWIVTRHLLK